MDCRTMEVFLAIAVRFGVTLYLFDTALVPEETTLHTVLQGRGLANGLVFVPFSYFVVVGSSNAVNLTDGWMAWPFCQR